MLVPISWLKEYVPIKMPLPRLLERLTEVGIGVENVHKKEEDTVLELEITPNRPDLLSIVGVAREAAAIQKTSIALPKATIAKPKKRLPITFKVDYALSPRITAVIIDTVKVKASPLWLHERLTSINQRPINNIVDITNFVMFELGNPIHAFDYEQIKGHVMTVTQALGGEQFISVDNIAYKLSKGAIIIKDKDRIIDLCGIKGGANSAITNKTKRVLLWAAVDDAKHIRKASQALSLRSEASSIYERGVDRAGTLPALVRATSLIHELAGGSIASKVFDLKKQQFTPWQITLSLPRLTRLLGHEIEEKKVVKILTALNLNPRVILGSRVKGGDSRIDSGQARMTTIECTIPTYRNDLHIEEDIIEEVARLYGYNKFPKTLPTGTIPVNPIPYESNFAQELWVKTMLTGLGLSEANTYSLVANGDGSLLHIANPISREFAVLRPTLLSNLLAAIPTNQKHHEHIGLFELGTVYHKEEGKPQEERSLAAVLYPADFFTMKGLVEALFEALAIPVGFLPLGERGIYHHKRAAHIVSDKTHLGTLGTLRGMDDVVAFEIEYAKLSLLLPSQRVFKPIPKHPPVIEDLSIIVAKNVLTADLVAEIKKVSPLIANIAFLDVYENTRTFRLTFQDPGKNLSGPDAAEIRKAILKRLKTKFSAVLKE